MSDLTNQQLLDTFTDVVRQEVNKTEDKLSRRFDGLETRSDHLETRFDGLESRFNKLDQMVGGISDTLTVVAENYATTADMKELTDKFNKHLQSDKASRRFLAKAAAAK